MGAETCRCGHIQKVHSQFHGVCVSPSCICLNYHPKETPPMSDPTPPSDTEALAEVLAVHTYVIDGPPATIGVRCACGFRQRDEYMTPEGADLAARLHVASALATDRAEAGDVELLACIEFLERHEVVAIGESDIGSNQIPQSPADSVRHYMASLKGVDDQ